MEKNEADFCQEFDLVNSTDQTIWENRTIFISAVEQNGSIIKRFWKPERNDIDEALLKWFQQEKLTMYQW